MNTSINTTKNGNGNAVNNGFQFPVYTGSTLPVYYSSTTDKNNVVTINSDEKNLYSICSDWVELVCTSEIPMEIIYRNHSNANIVVEKISVHKNPNFRNLNRIYLHGVEVCDIFSDSNNGTHSYKEVSVKVANALLYTLDWVNLVRHVVRSFNLSFVKMARQDIALDGMELTKVDVVLNKFAKSHTIQVNNDSLRILPLSFKKKELKWTGWSIGCKKSGISARYYEKTEEIKHNHKEYILDFWSKNNISSERVGRFEIQLNNKRLKKYRIDLDNMELLMNAEFLSTVFQQEVRPWLKFYQVKRKDFINHRKEIAVRKGREISIIDWNHLPNRIELLEYNIHKPHSNIVMARNTISFTLREILHNPSTSTTAQVDVIEQYAQEYHLTEYVQNKIRILFGDEIDPKYFKHLQRFIKGKNEPPVEAGTD
jgi:hypothetical protein